MRDEIDAIVVRHVDERRLDPAQRPPGALPVEVVYFAYPRQDLAAQLPADDNDGNDDSDNHDSDNHDENGEGDAAGELA